MLHLNIFCFVVFRLAVGPFVPLQKKDPFFAISVLVSLLNSIQICNTDNYFLLLTPESWHGMNKYMCNMKAIGDHHNQTDSKKP